MIPDPAAQKGLAAVPLFPLPNVVLLPSAVLPLHVFEERYKQMTAEVLRGEQGGRRVAMALLRPGWEKCYYESPAIEPVVCVGEILSHERLPDGRYNFLLRGVARARVVRELRKRPYRVAELEPIVERPVMEIELAGYRRHLRAVFEDGPLGRTGAGCQIAKMLASDVPTAEVADVLAFNLFDDLRLKQALLEEGDAARRVARTVEAIDRLVRLVTAAAERDKEGPCLN
jgi:Lon protease-like protein